jgi:hypothetical protein
MTLHLPQIWTLSTGGPRRTRFGALLFFAASALTVLSVAGAADDERADIGVVEQVQNLAVALYAERSRHLQPSSSLYYLDLLRTGPQARLTAELADGSRITMGENAELAVDQFVYAPGDSVDMTLRALKGALLFISDKLRGDGEHRVQVRTPVAILGVRGTEFWVGPIDGATGVLVIDGEVSVGSGKGTVILGPGEGTMVAVDGTLSPVKTWGAAKVERALEMVRFD